MPRLLPLFSAADPLRYFDGHLYPLEGSTPQAFEVDAPLETERGTAYYAFTARFGLQNGELLGLELRRPDGTRRSLPHVEGPCEDPVAADAQRRLMRSNALRWTGVDGPAAFHPSVEERLDAGAALSFLPCDAGSELDSGGGLTVARSVLLPANVLEGGAVLEATTTVIGGTQISRPLQIPLVVSPLRLAVVGDSVAWGQGVPEASKWYSLIRDRLAATKGPIASPVVRAHSGAAFHERAGSDLSTVSIATATGCAAMADVAGEVPRSQPIIPCQIQSLSRARCQVRTSTAAPPTFDCTATGGSGPFADFDLRPRWDYVLMNGCINDIGAGNLVMGLPPVVGEPFVSQATRSSCDLSTAVPDLGAFLPNATVVVIGYHLVVSHDSDANRSGCLPAPPLPAPTIPPDILTSAPVAMFLALQAATAASASRMITFRTVSDETLSSSLRQLAPAAGVGRSLFVSLVPRWGADQATFARHSMNFGLRCTTGDVPYSPVDPVARERAAACALAVASDALADAAMEQSCRRASAFHPNLVGHAAIADAVIDALSGRAVACATCGSGQPCAAGLVCHSGRCEQPCPPGVAVVGPNCECPPPGPPLGLCSACGVGTPPCAFPLVCHAGRCEEPCPGPVRADCTCSVR